MDSVCLVCRSFASDGFQTFAKDGYVKWTHLCNSFLYQTLSFHPLSLMPPEYIFHNRLKMSVNIAKRRQALFFFFWSMISLSSSEDIDSERTIRAIRVALIVLTDSFLLSIDVTLTNMLFKSQLSHFLLNVFAFLPHCWETLDFH